MIGPIRCSKCGEWMTMNIEYICGAPNISYRCPNGCQTNEQISYTASTYTAIIRKSRYCSQKQCMCENANDRGYCEFIACIYEDALNRGNNEKQIISIPKITIS